MIQTNSLRKQIRTHRLRARTYGWGDGRVRGCGKGTCTRLRPRWIATGPPAQHMGPCSGQPGEEGACIRNAEPLPWSSEIITKLLISYTPIQNKGLKRPKPEWAQGWLLASHWGGRESLLGSLQADFSGDDAWVRLRDARVAGRFGGSDGGRWGTSRSTEGAARGAADTRTVPSNTRPASLETLAIWDYEQQISASETALPLLFTKSHLAQSQPPYTVGGGEEERAALRTSHPQPLLSPEVTGSARRGRRNGQLQFRSDLSHEAGLDQQSAWWSVFWARLPRCLHCSTVLMHLRPLSLMSLIFIYFNYGL